MISQKTIDGQRVSKIQMKPSYESQEEEEEEGFIWKQSFGLQIVKKIIDYGAQVHQNNEKPPKEKIAVLKNPQCIYFDNHLFCYSRKSDCIPDSLEEAENKFSLTKIDSIVGNGEPVSKLSDFVRKDNLRCIYNKHNQNIQSKSDPNLFIKNIKLAIQSDTIKQFTGEAMEYEKRIPKNRLSFFSNFETGNLQFVFAEHFTNNYYLLLQNDINTHGYNQWLNFYVRVNDLKDFIDMDQITLKKRNMSKKGNIGENLSAKTCVQNLSPHQFEANFIILNISKDIRFKPGMKILSFCQGRWTANTPFIYYKNKYQRYNGTNYSTLQFSYTFHIDQVQSNSIVQFSLTFPYTYSKMISELEWVGSQSSAKWDTSVETIAKSQGNNPIYLVKLMKKQSQDFSYRKLSESKRKEKILRKCVVIIARQHPVETVSSYVCQALIRCVFNSPLDYQQENFDWFFIPMANPDGVIHGNSRTNLKGYDINRCWQKHGLNLSLQVSGIYKYIEQLKNSYKISYIIDLHGHSKDFGAFAYFSENNIENKIISLLLSQKCTFFSFQKSKYGIDYKKRPTFRAQMFYRQQIKNAITIETSLFGFQQNEGIRYFGKKHYQELATAIYTTLNSFEGQMRIAMLKEEDRQTLIKKISEIQSIQLPTFGRQNEDSDSDPEDEYLETIERISLGVQKQPEAVDTSESAKQREMQQIEVGLRENESFGLEKDWYQNGSEIKQSSNIAPLNRFGNLIKKSKLIKSERKPIYTNTNVNISKFIQIANKKSLDNAYSQKKIGHIPQNSMKREKQKQQKKINGQAMRSHQSFMYPTASNIKINIYQALQLCLKEKLHQTSNEWTRNQRLHSGLCRRSARSATITKYMSNIKGYHIESQRKKMQSKLVAKSFSSTHNQFKKLKQFLIKQRPSRKEAKSVEQPKQQSKMKLMVISKKMNF